MAPVPRLTRGCGAVAAGDASGVPAPNPLRRNGFRRGAPCAMWSCAVRRPHHGGPHGPRPEAQPRPEDGGKDARQAPGCATGTGAPSRTGCTTSSPCVGAPGTPGLGTGQDAPHDAKRRSPPSRPVAHPTHATHALGCARTERGRDAPSVLPLASDRPGDRNPPDSGGATGGAPASGTARVRLAAPLADLSAVCHG